MASFLSQLVLHGFCFHNRQCEERALAAETRKSELEAEVKEQALKIRALERELADRDGHRPSSTQISKAPSEAKLAPKVETPAGSAKGGPRKASPVGDKKLSPRPSSRTSPASKKSKSTSSSKK